MAGQKAVSRYKICIVTEAVGLAWRWAGRAGRACEARVERGVRRWGAQARRASAALRYGAGLATTRPLTHGLSAAWARLGSGLCALAGPCWGTVHLTQFLTSFDSVLFLSQCLDTVHEPSS